MVVSNSVSEIESSDDNITIHVMDGISFEMVKVEAGSFYMGATPVMEKPWRDEFPVHNVTLTKNYYLGKYEVTQALWQAVMGKNPSKKQEPNLPVERVSWKDCRKFISQLNQLTGRKFRLPTEAEWEYAARGGKKSRGYQYSGSNTLDDVAWYGDNSGKKTHAVGTKQPNELGIYDMSGNVLELCQDRYGRYNANSQTNPTGANRGSDCVMRGGSWDRDARFCRSSCRSANSFDDHDNSVGLRLALSE